MASSLISRYTDRSLIKPVGRVALAASMLATSVATVLPAATSAQDLGDTLAASVPADSLFYAELNADQDSDQYATAQDLLERSGIGAYLTEEDMDSINEVQLGADVLVDQDAAFVLTSIPEGETLDEVTSDLDDVSADPSMALEEGVPGGWSILLRSSDPDQLYQLITEGQEEDSGSAESSEYNGVEIVTYTPADTSSEPMAIAQIDDVVVLATTPTDIEPIIDTKAGDLDNLADDEIYGEIRGELNGETLINGYVNGTAMLAQAEEQDPEMMETVPPEYLAMLNATSGFAFWADDPGFRFDLISKPGDGNSFVALDNLSGDFAGKVEDNSLFYVGGMDLGAEPSINALALLFAQEVVGIGADATPVAEVDPEAYAEEIFAQAEEQLGFNIKTDLLDHLNGEWGLTGSVSDISTETPEFSALFSTGTDDPEALNETVGTITDMIQASDETVEFGTRSVDGGELTTVDLSDDAGIPMVLEYGVVGDEMLIGVNDGIDTYLEGPEAPLADSEAYSETMGALPSEYSAVSFLNGPVAIELANEFAEAYSGAYNIVDADPSCGDYATQEEAQEAYDEDNFENYLLDQDYDGEACEDFFNPATPVTESEPMIVLNVLGAGFVTSQSEDTMTVNGIIRIGE